MKYQINDLHSYKMLPNFNNDVIISATISGRAARLLVFAALEYHLLTADFTHLYDTLSISLSILHISLHSFHNFFYE